MSDKAKYIQEKERTLYNDLEKAYKKLKEVTNWYSLSSYDLTFDDIKNHRLYMLKINNLYHEMKDLLISSKDIESLKEYDRVITHKRIDSLEELENVILHKDITQKDSLTD